MKGIKTTILFFLATIISFGVVAGDKVNINTADAEILSEMIAGVGEKRAQAIIEYREQYGAFQSVDELSRVKGINISLIEKNRDRLSIGEHTGE